MFSSIAGNEYYVYSVNENFEDRQYTNFSGYDYPSAIYNGDVGSQTVAQEMFLRAQEGTLEKLQPSACIDAYATNFQTSRGSVLLVVPNTSSDRFNVSRPILEFEDQEELPVNEFNRCPPFGWICNQLGRECNRPCQFRLGSLRGNLTAWQPFHKEILYCLSVKVEENCRLQYSTHLATVVVILNAVKAMIMLYLVFGIKELPLMTVGDAVSSFLQRPDATTDGMCLVAKKDIRKDRHGDGWTQSARQYSSMPQKRFAGASTSRWWISMIL